MGIQACELGQRLGSSATDVVDVIQGTIERISVSDCSLLGCKSLQKLDCVQIPVCCFQSKRICSGCLQLCRYVDVVDDKLNAY